MEARLRRLEDAEEIRRLLLEYARLLDAGDYRGYAELFADDGVLEAQLGRAAGRDAIVALLEERLASAPDRPRRRAFHLVGNATIEVGEDTATSVALWAYLTHDDDGFPMILQLGHYRDDLVRERGAWRFKRRAISRDLGFSPLDVPPHGGD
jgi:uncharacterized protein (TIGR02246 family)